jgi:ABC-type transport system involved in multi-copper enzyme maturation permease subunit
MKNIITLTYYEIRKFWTIPKLIIYGVITLLGLVLGMIPYWAGLFKNEFVVLKFSSTASTLLGFVVPISVFLFTSGIISADVKSHWLRSILSRPIAKYEYLTAKYLSVIFSILASMLLLVLLPSFVVYSTSSGKVSFDFVNTFSEFLLSFFEGFLFVSIAVWFSCFMNGFLNIFILAIWMFLENVIVSPIISNFVIDSRFGSIFVDFFFPTGFSEASKIISTGGDFPFEKILWGLSALFMFLSLSYYHITLIKTDTNSD